MKNKKNKKIALIMYESIFAILALVVVSYAWFVYTNEVSTTGISMSVESAINIAISEDSTNWGNSIEILVDGEQKISELSGDGKNLFYPIIESGNVINRYASVEGTLAETHFIEFLVYIKSDGPISLYLAPGSYVQPLNDSSLKDNIAGAVRVACYDANSSSDVIVWAPNSTYQYVNDKNVNKNGTVESSYTYATGPTTKKTILTNGQKSGVSEDKTFIWGDITEQTYALMKPLLTVSSPERIEITNVVIVRVWIEGNDREAQRALIGGKFRIFLNMRAGHAYEE